jgi:hypothetical protein
MKKAILLLTALTVSLTITAFADRTFTRTFTDNRCQTHLQEWSVDDDGNETLESDSIIGVTAPCDGDDGVQL